MSDFKKGVFATAAVCSVISLLEYARWVYGEEFWFAVTGGLMFLFAALLFLASVGFVIVTVVSVALSIWFMLEWCCRKAWGLFRRWRVRA